MGFSVPPPKEEATRKWESNTVGSETEKEGKSSLAWGKQRVRS